MSVLRGLSLVVRLFAVGTVVASPWIGAMPRPSDQRSVVFVIDRSSSMGEMGLDQANDLLHRAFAEKGPGPTPAKIGVVAFDGEAEVLAPVGTYSAPRIRAGSQPQSSDLASGIRLGLASLPVEGHRTLVLVTDAQPTRGDAAAEVARAAQLGVRVSVVPLEGTATRSMVITNVKPRATHVAEHQPVAIDVDVHADSHFMITWKRDGVPLPHKQEYFNRRAEETQKSVALLDPDPPPGIHVYEVQVQPYRGFGKFASSGDAVPMLTAVSVEGRAHAAVFSSTGDVPPVLKSALTESGLEARSLPIERASDPSSYSGADLVVLADARVSGAQTDDAGLTRTAQAALVDYVQQGGGLLVTGGVFGLAPEYSGTPLSRVLPVEIEDRGHVEDPPVALAIMLDRSGSMAAPVGAHTKLDLAIEASLAAADVLRPTDQLALASVDTQTHWDIPLGTLDHLPEQRAAVRRVTAGGGGIYVYTALRDAYEALSKVRAPIRHVILFSDTSDSEEQSDGCVYEPVCGGKKTAEQLTKEARAAGITTTVVGIGEEEAQHTEFLRRLAKASGGRFYITTEGTDLRRIFLSETRVLAQSNLREKRTKISAAGPHPVLEGVDARKIPELSAYVEAGVRPGADTALLLADETRPEGRPMLATWRYGLGKAGAITTDLSEGWGKWAGSPAAAQVLRQTVRFLLRQQDAHRADTTVRIKDRIVEVDIELPPDAPDSAAPKTIDVFAIGPARGAEAGRPGEEPDTATSRKIPMDLEQRGPGHWVARGRSAGEPIVIARARDARGALMAEAVAREDRAAELSGEGSDMTLIAELARIGGGDVSPTTKQMFSPTARPNPQLVARWPYALVFAAFLVVVDLILRRLGERVEARNAPIRLGAASDFARHARVI